MHPWSVFPYIISQGLCSQQTGAVNSPLILDIIRELQAKYRDAPDSLVIAATNGVYPVEVLY